MTTHDLWRIDEERDSDGYTRWRWVCACRLTSRGGLGRWNYQSENVARTAHAQHADKFKGPKALRALLKFD